MRPCSPTPASCGGASICAGASAPEEIDRLHLAQLELLRQAAPRLKPGGTLVYSTCSLEPEENTEVVKQFLAEHSHFKLEHERELLPFVDGVDGAYIARFSSPPKAQSH